MGLGRGRRHAKEGATLKLGTALLQPDSIILFFAEVSIPN